jgi:hypothetical protein
VEPDRVAECHRYPLPKKAVSEPFRVEDWERLVTFYAFPKEHWKHLRTTNVVESPFAAVRRRPAAAKRFKKVVPAAPARGGCEHRRTSPRNRGPPVLACVRSSYD